MGQRGSLAFPCSLRSITVGVVDLLWERRAALPLLHPAISWWACLPLQTSFGFRELGFHQSSATPGKSRSMELSLKKKENWTKGRCCLQGRWWGLNSTKTLSSSFPVERNHQLPIVPALSTPAHSLLPPDAGHRCLPVLPGRIAVPCAPPSALPSPLVTEIPAGHFLLRRTKVSSLLSQ